MAAVRARLRATYSLEVELAFVGLVLLAWHAVRIPLEGNVAISLAHAEDILRIERALSLDIEGWFIERSATSNVSAALEWIYANVHLPVLFGFMAAARLLAPDRYPIVRTTFVLSFVPAVLVIGLYPLAPPHWLPEFGLGVPPADAELASSTGALFHNVTAAAASQHFGFAVFLAATTIWLVPRSRLAWATLVYPALVFFVIVGTGNHYFIDCLVGTLTFALAAFLAFRIHRPAKSEHVVVDTTGAASVALGYALVAWGFVSLELTMPTGWHSVPDALALVGGVVLIVAPRLATKEALAETG